MLDATFQEDGCLRAAILRAAWAALPHIALHFLTILKQHFWPKVSIRRLRKMVACKLARLEPMMVL